MDFTKYKDESKRLGISTGDYYKLSQGENKLRVLTAPEAFAQHFIGKGIKPAPCTTGCGYCLKGAKKGVKIALYILDRSDEVIKLAELPYSIFTGIGELAISSEYGFKGLPPYDLIITKTGEMLETKYSVMAGRNEAPITEAQKKELAGKKPILEYLKAKMTPETPVGEMLHDLPDMPPDYGDKELLPFD